MKKLLGITAIFTVAIILTFSAFAIENLEAFSVDVNSDINIIIGIPENGNLKSAYVKLEDDGSEYSRNGVEISKTGDYEYQVTLTLKKTSGEAFLDEAELARIKVNGNAPDSCSIDKDGNAVVTYLYNVIEENDIEYAPEKEKVNVSVTTDIGDGEYELSFLSEDNAELVILIDDYKIREFDVKLEAEYGIKTNVIVKYKHVVTDTTMVIKSLSVFDENGSQIEGVSYEKNGWDYNFTVENSVNIKLAVVPVGALPLEDRAHNAEILVNVNGRVLDFDVKPVLENGRTLVPLRGIFEALGAEVLWDDETQTVTAVRGDITIKLTIGEKVLYRNGKAIELDVPARLEGWRTLVPLRAVSEAFGCYVEWHDNARTVMVAD